MNSLGLGGTEINAVQFAAAVRAHGYESVLVAPADSLPSGPSIRDVAASYGLTVETFDRPSRTLDATRLLIRLASGAKADIVHVYGQGEMRGAFYGPCRLGRRPMVITAYEMEVSPTTLAGPPLIVGTRNLFDELQSRPGRTVMISPPVDLVHDSVGAVRSEDFRRRWAPIPDELLLVWVGRLDATMKEPALRAAIGAMLKLEVPARLVIVGTGVAEGRLRQQASKVNDALRREAVVFAGSMSDPRVAYAAADVGLGMGSSAARVLAFGKPLVALGEAGWSRAFTPQSADAVFRDSFWSRELVADASDRLVAQLAPLLDDPRLRRQLGEFGRVFAERAFGLDTMASRLADVYDRAREDFSRGRWFVDAARDGVTRRHRACRRFVAPLSGHRRAKRGSECKEPARD